MVEMSEARFEEFVKDSVILDLIKNYIHSNKYVSRDTLLIILGESEEKENGI